MFPQHIAKRLRLQHLQAPALSTGQHVHRQRHLGSEEARALLSPPAAGRAGGFWVRGSDWSGYDGAQVGETRFAAYAEFFLDREVGSFNCRLSTCRASALLGGLAARVGFHDGAALRVDMA